jgi:hypothetical protein
MQLLFCGQGDDITNQMLYRGILSAITSLMRDISVHGQISSMVGRYPQASGESL